ncbi:hypothetical protein SAMN05428949_6489 [Chitinophaga sp. YR627]|uniref:hypothetical protein n=1 Tax=Chitinophaga sp. YR627 TaxID=1881041 RepID=UPI0008E38840|nr:hypothetical protein [Chitinophaga sp. YR627]SFO75446.1 hypothetical protein SAMN05428949_6489 [Chitinophaga sp. YR627]
MQVIICIEEFLKIDERLVNRGITHFTQTNGELGTSLMADLKMFSLMTQRGRDGD